jgi:hypothetical protein
LNYSRIPFNELRVEKEVEEVNNIRTALGKWNEAFVILKFCKLKKELEEFMTELKPIMYVITFPNLIPFSH